MPFLLAPDDYPARLRELASNPPCIWLSAPLPSPSARWVAIVGTRRPTEEAEAYASSLAFDVVRAGGVVVSGGALGIDAAAHRGALDGGGATCVVMPTGHGYTYPRQNAELFARVEASGGARVWPFPPEQNAQTWTFHKRNAVLAALADVLVIVQAGIGSGAQSAARCARALKRPILAAAAPPWMTAFAGSSEEVSRGATLLLSTAQVLEAAQLGASANSTSSALKPPASAQEPLRSEHERRILEALRDAPKHKDELCAITALPPSAVSMALLTLSLEHVLVEGPDGSFRRNLA